MRLLQAYKDILYFVALTYNIWIDLTWLIDLTYNRRIDGLFL